MSCSSRRRGVEVEVAATVGAARGSRRRRAKVNLEANLHNKARVNPEANLQRRTRVSLRGSLRRRAEVRPRTNLHRKVKVNPKADLRKARVSLRASLRRRAQRVAPHRQVSRRARHPWSETIYRLRRGK
jgi:nucleoid-associated protein YgaU